VKIELRMDYEASQSREIAFISRDWFCGVKRLLRIAAVFFSLSLTAFAGHLVRDELGREVTVPDHAHRIVCLAPSITDMIYALGRGDDIAGITDYSKYPAEAVKKPSVGGVIDPSLEKLISLRPDLVLAAADLNSPDLIRSIERLGVPVFILHPHGFHDIYRSLESVGKAIDGERPAAALIAKLQARETAVRQRVAGKSRPSVFFLLWPDPIMSAGRGAFITELIEAAGGRSVTAELPSEWPSLSLESVLAERPEYLLLVRGSHVTLETLRGQGNWIKLDAVRQGKVFYADDRIEYPSPVALDALEDLAGQIHPPK
jgi:ABC-type Fe3+-hydroxamate transport system substrate-binding protein